MKKVFSDGLYLFWVHIQSSEWYNAVIFYTSQCNGGGLLRLYLHINIRWFGLCL